MPAYCNDEPREKSGGCWFVTDAVCDPAESTDGELLLFVDVDDRAPKEASEGLLRQVVVEDVSSTVPLSVLPGDGPREEGAIAIVVVVAETELAVVVGLVTVSACRS